MIDYCQIQTTQGTIRGSIHNNSALNENNVFALLVHGYLSSNRIGPNRLYFRLANAIAENLNITVARFDCYGMGESDGDLSSTSFNDFIESYKSILNYFLEKCKNTKIILIGHCVGANIATELAALYKKNTIDVLLISPNFCDSYSLTKFFSDEQQFELKKKGHTVRKGIVVNSTFFFGRNTAENVVSRIEALTCGWCLVIGTKDEFFNYMPTKNKLSSSFIIEIENADHNYLGQYESKLLIESCIKYLRSKINNNL